MVDSGGIFISVFFVAGQFKLLAMKKSYICHAPANVCPFKCGNLPKLHGKPVPFWDWTTFANAQKCQGSGI
jgi:hypothetical protein